MINHTFFQKTIKKKILFIGKGIHKNKINLIILYPKEINFGLKIKYKNIIIPIHYLYLKETLFQVSLKNQQATIYTIEHLLFSLYILGISNCLIVFEQSNEIPIFDGSAYYFIKKILNVGLEIQKDIFPVYTLNKELKLKNDSSQIYYKPFKGIKINYFFQIKNLKENHFEFLIPFHENFWSNFTNQAILQLSKARTFGYFEDWFWIKKKGFGYGANSKNTLIFYLDKTKPIPKLRLPKEWIRHKILDFISILGLIPYRILGHFIIHQSGHFLDSQFIRQFDQEIQKIKLQKEFQKSLF